MVSPVAIFAVVLVAAGLPAALVLLRLRASDTLTRAVRDELLASIGALRRDLAVARFLAPSAPDPVVHAAPAPAAPPAASPAERTTPVGEGEDEPEAELTQVWNSSRRPAVVLRPGAGPVPFPDLTGSADETPPRGTPRK